MNLNRRRLRKRRRNKPWVTKGLKRQMQLRDVMRHAYRRNACDTKLAVYNTHRNKCAHMQRKAGIRFETNLAQKAATYPKIMFFGHLQHDSKLPNQIVALKHIHSEPTTEPASQSETFAAHFRELHTRDTAKPTSHIHGEAILMPYMLIEANFVQHTLTPRIPHKGIRRFSRPLLPKWPNHWQIFSTYRWLLQRYLMNGEHPLCALTSKG